MSKKMGERYRGGFTVIEVVLVLAIAGLVFAMVFIAVPSLQRSQRDNDRRDDMTQFVTEVKRYQTSNRGNLPGGGESSATVFGSTVDFDNDGKNSPTTWKGFYANYLGNKFMDPNGSLYNLNVVECGAKRADSPCEGSASTALSTIQSASFDSNNYTLLVVTRGKCNGNDVVGSSSPRNLAVVYRLEGSGAYCYGT